MADFANLNISQLHSYEYCPARYYFERKKVPLGVQIVRSAIDAKRMLFREFFRSSTENSATRFRLAERTIAKYSKYLGQDDLPTRIQAVHLLKTYDKLRAGLKADTYEIPAPISVRINRWCYIHLMVDMIAITPKQTIFVILVSADQWTPEDISNKFENYLITDLLWPEMRKDSPDDRRQFKICYFCPDNGKSCVLNQVQLQKFHLGKIKRRIVHAVNQVNLKYYEKMPTGTKCSACPVYEQCHPNLFVSSTFGEKIETIEAPLYL